MPVRKLSPEDIAAQTVLDFFHVQKAQLRTTDEELRAWRPPATDGTVEPASSEPSTIVAATAALAAAEERRATAWQHWLDMVRGIPVTDVEALMAPEVRRANDDADAALAAVKRARAGVEMVRRAALPVGSCAGSEAQLEVGGREIPRSEMTPDGPFAPEYMSLFEIDTNFYCSRCRARWTRRYIWSLRRGEYAPVHAPVAVGARATA